ncbi:hypothetical protein HAZT_HAZT008012 [Hyalella azteca]|uniref:Lysosomal alpha-glucosidase n=1 Tax=Hyalella azteca TaxID=294128 RepID=A0A6A0H1U4_HYAAZ|nr:lysosomal alpha-glucosidase [Hyalella azteca]KAA0195144.1 hypothetical protein HAZT_HAZT008012 [Hyalella azteca]
MLKVKFPSIGEYEYDRNGKMSHVNDDDKLERERHDEEFWAKYDPFEPYDHFDSYDAYESYGKWQDECLNEAMREPILYTSLTGLDPPCPNGAKTHPEKSSDKPATLGAKEFMEGKFRVMFHPVQEMNPSCLVYSLRLLACLVLAVALYCFCNGYQEVKFLEIVNKCLEGEHNPMCQGFMEPEGTMNDYKSITVQEDMYSDRLEWIPKEMTPAQEYVTLVSILERHPCQSLRCLDKLTAQIYGGKETGLTPTQNSRNSSGRNSIQKPELHDRMDDVLKKMDNYDGSELKKEVIKKNKEYLDVDGAIDSAAHAVAGQITSKRVLELNKAVYRRMSVQNSNRRTQNVSPDVYGDLEGNAPFLGNLVRKKPRDLPERSDFLIDSLVDRVSANDEELLSVKVYPKNDKAPSAPKWADAPEECAAVVTSRRFDCHPGQGASKEVCIARGCCWRPVDVSNNVKNQTRSNSTAGSARISPPYCFFPPSHASYRVVHHQDTPTGQEALLQLMRPSGHDGDQAELRLQVTYESETRLKIQIQPSSRDAPWVPVLPLTAKSGPTLAGVNPHQMQRQYRVSLTRHNAALTVTRTETNTTMFSTQDAAPLIFARQFVQVSSVLPSSAVYGLGQHRDGLLLDVDWSRYIMWNADQIPEPGLNLYGSHPFYLAMESGGTSHGVLFLTSNAMSATLQPAPSVTLQSSGDLITLYIFTGPTPADVVRQYTQLVGRPAMPPYWALGYHQCRFNYGTLEKTKKVWKRTRDAGIPFDVQWNDLDYMSGREDFTYDQEKFSGLPQFVEELHELGMHYVPIIDPGISASDAPGSYPPYDEGTKMGIFIRNASGQDFKGRVWSRGDTVWPDFSHPRALYYWARQLVRFHGVVPFDGAWIDMNEPSNFFSGTAYGCNDSDPINSPPWVPSGLVGASLYHKTLCPDAKQYVGKHYDLHNLFGNMEAVATNVGLKVTRGERPLVISRASFPGLGVWAGHWTGDVASDWDNLRASVPDVLNFNLFGIPLVGADICGFNGNTTPSLCLRWMQLGAFYPFSRNHNTDTAIDQDPVALGPDVVNASRQALTERYRLLPYLYTLFYRAHVYGDTVARPLFLQFPQDAATYSIETQFLWGDAIMIVPALEEDVTTVEAYLPCGSIWYDWYTGERVASDDSSHYAASISEASHPRPGNSSDHSDADENPDENEVLNSTPSRKIVSVAHVDLKTLAASEIVQPSINIELQTGVEDHDSSSKNQREESNAFSVGKVEAGSNTDRTLDAETHSRSLIFQETAPEYPLLAEDIFGNFSSSDAALDYSSSDADNDIDALNQPLISDSNSSHYNSGNILSSGVDSESFEFEASPYLSRVDSEQRVEVTEPGCFYTQLAAPLDVVPLLMRGGTCVPTQEPAATTTDSRSKPLSVVVALDQAGEAHGLLYLDDGVSIGQFLAADMPCYNVDTIAVILCYT